MLSIFTHKLYINLNVILLNYNEYRSMFKLEHLRILSNNISNNILKIYNNNTVLDINSNTIDDSIKILYEYINQYKLHSYIIIPYLKYLDNTKNTQLYNAILELVFNNYNIYANCKSRNSNEFVNNVKQLANNKCQVTALSNIFCQVCHIYPFSKCILDNDKYNKYNGLLLKDTIHKLFDKNIIKIYYDDNNANIYFKINKHIFTEKTTILNEILLELDNNINYVNLSLDDIYNIKFNIYIDKSKYNYYKVYINKYKSLDIKNYYKNCNI